MKTWQEAFKRMQDRGIKFQLSRRTNNAWEDFGTLKFADKRERYRIDPTQTSPDNWHEIYREAQDNGVRFECGGIVAGDAYRFNGNFISYKISGFEPTDQKFNEPKITSLPPLDITITLTSKADEQFKADIEAANAALAERKKVGPYRHLLHALAAGKRIRLRYSDGSCSGYEGLPDYKFAFSEPPDRYEIEPDTKRIDWSKMPDDTRVIYARLNGEKSSAYIYKGGVTINPGWEGNDIYSITNGIKLKLCDDQPWVVWFGGECPVPEGVIVEMVLRSAEIMEGEANFFAWDHDAIPG
ncbi:MAG: hypothetical protein ACYC4K_08240, partial [Thiobacillus sp.]